jgi:hypothetical protein
MSPHFEYAAASVVGREHVRTGRNNQDAFCIDHGPGGSIAVVADGCSSGVSSEIGARIGARLLLVALRAELESRQQRPVEAVLESARSQVLRELRRLTAAMGGCLEQIVTDHFLFTLVGVVLGDATTTLFALGDGVLALNGEVCTLQAPDNAPAYLGYGLTGTLPDAALRFDIHRQLPTAAVRSVLVASDGAAHVTEDLIPMLWQDERHFRNPDGLARRLRLLNRDASRIDWDARRVTRERPLLPDDTTVVVIRRREAA